MTSFADQLLEMLKVERANLNITPEIPITAGGIAERWNLKYPKDKIDLRGVAVRHAVNELRNRNEPIGSGTQGYWYIIKAEEWDGVIAHLTSRAREIENVLSHAKRCKDNMFKREQGLFDKPTLKAIELEFGTVVV